MKNAYDPTEARVALRGLAQAMRANSERWFTYLHSGAVDLRTFYALGLAGEVGEVANEVKKLMRRVGGDYSKLRTELADAFTYLLLLSDELDVDLVGEYEAKVDVNELRWG